MTHDFIVLPIGDRVTNAGYHFLVVTLSLALAWPHNLVRAQDVPTLVAPNIFNLKTPSDIPEAESKSEVANQLYEIIRTGRGEHPLDTFQLLNQTSSERTSFFADVDALVLEVVDGSGQVVDSISARASQKANHFFNSTNGAHDFRLVYQGSVLHTFFIPVKSIGFLGHHLVFVKDQSKVEPQRRVISFIDLDYFTSAIGTTELPIFSIPTFGEDISQINLSARGQLALPKNLLRTQVFDLFSQVQQTSFNMTVLMTDSEKTSQVLPVQDNFAEYFEKAVELQGESLMDQMQTSETYKSEFDVL